MKYFKVATATLVAMVATGFVLYQVKEALGFADTWLTGAIILIVMISAGQWAAQKTIERLFK